MLTFLKVNYLTIIISLLLLASVVLILRNLIGNKKKGAGTCEGDCGNCAAGCIHSDAKFTGVKTTVVIDGMVCGMCESHLNAVIRQNFQVDKVSSSYRNGVMTIISKKRLDNNRIKDVISQTGYSVKSIHIEPYN